MRDPAVRHNAVVGRGPCGTLAGRNPQQRIEGRGFENSQGIKALKDLHQAMHPAASLPRRSRHSVPHGNDATPEALLEGLEEEAAEETE